MKAVTTRRGRASADLLIEETRRVREALSARFDNNLEKLCGHLRKIEREQQARVVRPSENSPLEPDRSK